MYVFCSFFCLLWSVSEFSLYLFFSISTLTSFSLISKPPSTQNSLTRTSATHSSLIIMVAPHRVGELCQGHPEGHLLLGNLPVYFHFCSTMSVYICFCLSVSVYLCLSIICLSMLVTLPNYVSLPLSYLI